MAESPSTNGMENGSGSRPSSKFRSRRSQAEQNLKKASRLATSLAPGETIKDKQVSFFNIYGCKIPN